VNNETDYQFRTRVFKYKGKWRLVNYMPYGGVGYDDFETWSIAMEHAWRAEEQKAWGG
jgi:hypothetical protein